MLSLKSDRGLGKFLAEGGVLVKVLIIACAGVLLMVLGAVASPDGGRSDAVTEQTMEERVADACSSVDGVGKCRVIITYGEDDDVYAVAVLCEGADSIYVRQGLTEMLSSLFGIGSNRISILKISE